MSKAILGITEIQKACIYDTNGKRFSDILIPEKLNQWNFLELKANIPPIVEITVNKNTTYLIEMNMLGYAQARKHKKRRINKKWLKRYGYRIISEKMKGRATQVAEQNGIDKEQK